MIFLMNKAVQPLLLLSVSMLLAQGALAQSSFEEGSFGSGSPDATTPAPTTGEDGNFSGSFEPGAGGTQEPVAPAQDSGNGFDEGSFNGGGTGGAGAQPPPQPVPDVGGDDFPGGGSFDPDFVPPTPQPPQPGPTPTPTPSPTPTPTPAPVPDNTITLDPQILAFESRDFGVPPTQQLRQGQFHAQTPTSLPGGNVVSTEGLANAMNGGMQMVLIDVLGSNYTLPNAYVARELASAGSLNDRTQQRASQWLGQITGGQADMPIVVFCSDPMCWLSYNASLRAVAAGYNNVYWYRGGLQAWQMAGLALGPAGY